MVGKRYIIDNMNRLYSILGIYEHEMLNRMDYAILNGDGYIQNRLETLINVTKFLWNKSEALEKENEALKLELQRLREESKRKDALLNKHSTHPTYSTKIGNKAAYKSEVSCELILQQLKMGKSKTRIARELGVDRSLVYERIKELESAGIDMSKYIKR